MRLVAYLKTNATVLNVILLCMAIAIVIMVIFPYTHMKVAFSIPKPVVKPVAGEDKGADVATSPSPSDFLVLADENLFHPERKMPVDKKAEIPKPELLLYGTLVSDGISLAFVEDKKSAKSTPGRGKRQSVIKKGEVVSGFTVTEIHVDRIVLARGEDKITVNLTAADKKREGEGAPPAPAAAPGKPAAKPTAGDAQTAEAVRKAADAMAGRIDRRAAPPIPRGVNLGGKPATPQYTPQRRTDGTIQPVPQPAPSSTSR